MPSTITATGTDRKNDMIVMIENSVMLSRDSCRETLPIMNRITEC